MLFSWLSCTGLFRYMLVTYFLFSSRDMYVLLLLARTLPLCRSKCVGLHLFNEHIGYSKLDESVLLDALASRFVKQCVPAESSEHIGSKHSPYT